MLFLQDLQFQIPTAERRTESLPQKAILGACQSSFSGDAILHKVTTWLGIRTASVAGVLGSFLLLDELTERSTVSKATSQYFCLAKSNSRCVKVDGCKNGGVVSSGSGDSRRQRAAEAMKSGRWLGGSP